MKIFRYILLLIAFFFIAFSYAQTKIYKGDSSSDKDLLFTIMNGKIFAGSLKGIIICNIKEDKIYYKNYGTDRDILFTIRNDYRVYKKKSIYRKDLVILIERNRIYDTDNSLLASKEGNKIYDGNSRLASHILFTVEGSLNSNELAAVILISLSAVKK
ncbi:hypothetical protein [Apibacter sp. HY039]|uniref:hypothetical protein n=1 Tax=Apibacter sp. HY039 TaxID=2501476 RepID=UPI000FEB78E4|nr:hypothetical protein [Apibacter sp. HY039]